MWALGNRATFYIFIYLIRTQYTFIIINYQGLDQENEYEIEMIKNDLIYILNRVLGI